MGEPIFDVTHLVTPATRERLLDEIRAEAEARGFRRAVEALRDEANRRSEQDGTPTGWAVYIAAADYLESLITEESDRG